MSDIVLKYPIDTSGVKTGNHVVGESHALNGRETRLIIPDYGTYFVASMVPVNSVTGLPLTSAQWRPGQESSKYGKQTADLVMILDGSLDGPIILDYQAVGGEQSYNRRAALELLTGINLAGDPLPLKDIVGFPDKVNALPHKQHASTIYGMRDVKSALDHLATNIQLGNKPAMDEVYAYIDRAITAAKAISGDGAESVMAQHVAAANPHPSLALASDVVSTLAQVRQPVNMIPAAGDSNVDLTSPLTGYKYQTLYGVAQASAQFQLSTKADMSNPIYDRTLGAVITFQPDVLLSPSTVYYWRCRYSDADGVWSAWSTVSSFNTAAITIAQPILSSPLPNVETKTETPTLTTGAFVITGATDTHASSDWEVWTGPNGTGTRVWSSLNDTVNKTTINVAPGIMVQDGKYYARARHKGLKYGYSAYAADVPFIAKWDPRPSVLGQAFGGGTYAGDITIGVGTYAVILAPKASEITAALTGNTSNTTNTSTNDSVLNTTALTASAVATSIVAKVKALSIGGFTDWQVPAMDVQKLIWTNMRPSLASAPAAYKTGGAEAFTEAYYWTSTAYNWVNSYTDPSTPIYGQVNNVQGYSASGTYFPGSNGSTPPASCPAGQTVGSVSHGYFFTVIGGQPATINSTSWTCQWYTTGVVGYSPGASHSDPYYYAKTKQMNSAGTESNAPKTTSYACRPVRIVRVA